MSRVVLIVDDEPLIRGLTTLMLEELGYEVVAAGCGAHALAKLAADRRIAIIITDIQMPGMNGYELAEKVQQDRPDVRVILFSGRADTKNGLPLIRKPYTQEELARMMAETSAQSA